MKVVFCASEVFPFAKTGGLGDVCGSLPFALEKLGIDVSIFMPGYRCITNAGHTVEQLTEGVSRATLGAKINVYFIDQASYFDRQGLYGDERGDYPDNLERFSYFCDQVLQLLKQLELQPGIVHCHDWQTALIPVYLKERYRSDPFYASIKSILTIHNLAFQGIFPKEQYTGLGLDKKLFDARCFEFHDQINLLKAGIIYSDNLTTVSPGYAKEIQTKQFGCGLEGVLQGRANKPVGILNGIDDRVWDPQTDMFIARTYSKDTCTAAKTVNKTQLQKELFLEVSQERPLLGFVGRLSHQKGVDLILESLEQIVAMKAQFVFLGVGDARYQEEIKAMAGKHQGAVAACFDFDEPLGHRVYAGSDFFLMPSRFEPCGLSQMISLRYGTIPVVFQTGGLADTIKPFNIFNRSGNGLVFTQYTRSCFLNILKKAVTVFQQKDKLERIRGNALRADFSWTHSAGEYRKLYQGVTG